MEKIGERGGAEESIEETVRVWRKLELGDAEKTRRAWRSLE